MHVALFISCLADNFFPRAGIAAVKVLEHLGCRVDFPAAQTCCGQPMYNTGHHDGAAKLAANLVRVLEPYPFIVTPSGSCAAMVRKHYPELLRPGSRGTGFQPVSDDLAQAARAVASRTYEFVEFLTRVLRLDAAKLAAMMPPRPSGPPTPVTYHYSCHLRDLGLTNEAELLLQAIPGIDYRPLPGLTTCCGFGGMFSVKNPDLSAAMAQEKAAEIAATGATTLICNEGGCALNIAGAARRAGNNIRMLSLAENLAEQLGLMKYDAPQ